MSENKTKTRTIAFRITEEEFALVEKAARDSGKNANDYCRDLALVESGQESALSPNERIIFEELAKVRYLLSIGLGLLSTGDLNKTSWEETKFQVDGFGEKIAGQLLARRKNKSG